MTTIDQYQHHHQHRRRRRHRSSTKTHPPTPLLPINPNPNPNPSSKSQTQTLPPFLPNPKSQSLPPFPPPDDTPPESQSQSQSTATFPSYGDVDPTTLPPPVLALCQILSKVPPEQVDSSLSCSRILPSPAQVDHVLKLSYASPAAAVNFFRWAGRLASASAPSASASSWNLIVDILGKNSLFDSMWDAIRDMKKLDGVLSLATFVSVFGSYCAAGRFKEAVLSFDYMDRFDVPQDVEAVNSLLCAILNAREDAHARTSHAFKFFDRIKSTVAPNARTFAILLQGLEKEGNASKAKKTFGEMIIRVGWNTDNMSAYDAFLTTLIRSSQAEEAIKFLHVMKTKNCLPGMKFFTNALDILVKLNNAKDAIYAWDIMVGSGLTPNSIMYNIIIGLLCNNDDIDNAFRLLDEMPFNGAFPDSLTYNLIFQCLIKNQKVRKAATFFYEMEKNEWPPMPANCTAAIKMFFDGYDPETAIEVWNCMIENRMSPMEESSYALLIGLRDLDRMTEVQIFAEKMLDRRIELDSTIMEKLKNGFSKARMMDAYDCLERRWNGR
ncbi:hypothetical protein ACLOJK_034140 [Asimina triloba]